jgi:hypothetical protein
MGGVTRRGLFQQILRDHSGPAQTWIGIMSTDDPWAWAAYGRLQRMLERVSVSDRGWAIEETMNLLIEEIAEGREVSEIQIGNLLTNRSAKHRRRRRYDHVSTFAGSGSEAHSGDACIELQSRLKRCSARDQSILIAIGHGITTREIGLAYARPEGTIKTWVHRARIKFGAEKSDPKWQSRIVRTGPDADAAQVKPNRENQKDGR